MNSYHAVKSNAQALPARRYWEQCASILALYY